MNWQAENVSLLIILLTFGATAYGFSRRDFFDKWSFDVEGVLLRKEYSRLLTAGFIHVDWWHFIFNMFTLYSFSRGLPMDGVSFLSVYLLGILGGNGLALYIHRNSGSYRAVGASGAVSAVIMMLICISPFGIRIFGLIPGVWFGILYILYSIYGIQNKRDQISHEAHLGGALIGILASLVLYGPQVKAHAHIPILLLGMIGVFLALVILRPEMLYIPQFWRKEALKVKETIGQNRTNTSNQRFNSPEEEINFLLDKGIENLSKKERKRLDDLSKGMY